MFLWLQAQEDDNQDDFYGDYEREDTLNIASSDRSISTVVIFRDGIEAANFNGHGLETYGTIKPPVVFYGAGASTGDIETDRVEVVQESSPTSFAPPQLGEKALLLLLSKDEREYLLGDLAEEFALYQSKYGNRFAKVWYYKQVISSAWPLLRKYLRWGVFIWVEEWIRRHI
jgi:hypothetical protein